MRQLRRMRSGLKSTELKCSRLLCFSSISHPYARANSVHPTFFEVQKFMNTLSIITPRQSSPIPRAESVLSSLLVFFMLYSLFVLVISLPAPARAENRTNNVALVKWVPLMERSAR
jgi:hypothetical protein